MAAPATRHDLPLDQGRTDSAAPAALGAAAGHGGDAGEICYQQGLAEAPALLAETSFRDFVVLYMAEGSKRKRNVVEFVNSDSHMIALANRWISTFARNPLRYRLQYHADHDIAELRQYWGGILNVVPDIISVLRKSNSGQLAKRQFRSEYGVLSISVGDTYLRARLQAWMDVVKAQW